MQPQNTDIRDVAIIGAGPVGLFAVFQCGMLGLSCHVIDSLEQIGGQCSALYPEKPIYDIPAFPEVSGATLIKNLEAQAAPFDPNYILNSKVVSLSSENGLWHLTTNGDVTLYAKKIIIAAGGGAFGPNKPPLEGLHDYEGTSVFYCVREKEAFKDKRVVIAGGGDSAVDWAIALSDVATSVHLIHRRDKFRAAPESIRKLENLSQAGLVHIETPYQLKSLKGNNGVLSGVCVSGKNNDKDIEADVLLPFYGLSMELGPIKDWDLDLNNAYININPATCQTSVAGIYAVGDIVSYQNKLKLILTGFSEAAMAAHAIYKEIHPDKELHFEYSTTKGIPA